MIAEYLPSMIFQLIFSCLSLSFTAMLFAAPLPGNALILPNALSLEYQQLAHSLLKYCTTAFVFCQFCLIALTAFLTWTATNSFSFIRAYLLAEPSSLSLGVGNTNTFLPLLILNLQVFSDLWASAKISVLSTEVSALTLHFIRISLAMMKLAVFLKILMGNASMVLTASRTLIILFISTLVRYSLFILSECSRSSFFLGPTPREGVLRVAMKLRLVLGLELSNSKLWLILKERSISVLWSLTLELLRMVRVEAWGEAKVLGFQNMGVLNIIYQSQKQNSCGVQGQRQPNNQGPRQPMAYFDKRCFEFTQGWYVSMQGRIVLKRAEHYFPQPLRIISPPG